MNPCYHELMNANSNCNGFRPIMYSSLCLRADSMPTALEALALGAYWRTATRVPGWQSRTSHRLCRAGLLTRACSRLPGPHSTTHRAGTVASQHGLLVQDEGRAHGGQDEPGVGQRHRDTGMMHRVPLNYGLTIAECGRTAQGRAYTGVYSVSRINNTAWLLIPRASYPHKECIESDTPAE